MLKMWCSVCYTSTGALNAMAKIETVTNIRSKIDTFVQLPRFKTGKNKIVSKCENVNNVCSQTVKIESLKKIRGRNGTSLVIL